jgi:hypothetical protein
MALSPFLSDDHFDSVRRAIDVDLDESILPNEIIRDDVYLKRAAQKIIFFDPLAETRTGDQEEAIILATIFQTAAYLVPALPNLVTEQFVDYRARFDPMSQHDQVQRLTSAVDEQIVIAVALDTPESFRRVGHFTLGRGKSYYRRRTILPCT